MTDQTGCGLSWLGTPKTGFLMTGIILFYAINVMLTAIQILYLGLILEFLIIGVE